MKEKIKSIFCCGDPSRGKVKRRRRVRYLQPNINVVVVFNFFLGTKEGEDQYILHDTEMTWNEAQEYCRKKHSDLASVRNAEEHSTIQKIANGNHVWVGLFRDPWTWSDRTDSSLRFWQKGQSIWSEDAEDCVALLKDQSGRWGPRICSETHPFICSCITPGSCIKYFHLSFQFGDSGVPHGTNVCVCLLLLIARKETIIKVRINPFESGLDFNDPAVQDSMLKQVRHQCRIIIIKSSRLCVRKNK